MAIDPLSVSKIYELQQDFAQAKIWLNYWRNAEGFSQGVAILDMNLDVVTAGCPDEAFYTQTNLY